MSDSNQNLFYLDELSNYKVASGYYDVRGWDVIDVENKTIGKVDHLLVNKADERVVYLDVEVDKDLIKDGYNTYQARAIDGVHGFLNKDGDDHLIVPIGMVRLNREQKRVLSKQINYTTFARARRFNKGTVIDREYELMLFHHYRGDDTIGTIAFNEQFYNQKEFDNSSHLNDTISDKSVI